MIYKSLPIKILYKDNENYYTNFYESNDILNEKCFVEITHHTK